MAYGRLVKIKKKTLLLLLLYLSVYKVRDISQKSQSEYDIYTVCVR